MIKFALFILAIAGCANDPKGKAIEPTADLYNENNNLNNIQYSNLKDLADTLLYYHNLLSHSNSRLIQTKYYLAYPNDAMQVDSLFAFTKEYKGPLSDEIEGLNYARSLFNLDAIEDSLLLRKVIDIVSDAEWKEGPISNFQYELEEYFLSNIDITVAFLDQCSPSETRDFWHFMLSGPGPEMVYSEVFTQSVEDRIRNISEPVFQQLVAVYNEMIKL